ncbi:MAG: exosortase W [Nitrospirae bacterium]|nr:exosortase W [Nitrospirota bacterium]
MKEMTITKPLSERKSISKKRWIQFAVLFGIFIYSYAPVLSGLISVWWGSSEHSHGFLVPLFSIYLVWIMRAQLKGIPIIPDYVLGILLTTFAGIIYIIGEQGGLELLRDLSLVASIAGMVLLLLGVKYLRALALPIAYLLFMIPVLGAFSDRIHWPFQLFSAKLGTKLMELTGVPVLLESQYIVLPNTTLKVAVECSGVRYLISVIAVGIPLAYFSQRTLLRRAMLVSVAVLIALFANSARIAFIGFWAHHFNAEIIHGPFHILQGFFVSVIGFIALFIGALFFHQKMDKADSPDSPVEDKRISQTSGFRFNISWVVAVGLLLLMSASSSLLRTEPVPLKTKLNDLTASIGEWKWDGLNSSLPLLFKIEGADEELLRVYQNAAGERITLYAGYYESQRQGKELVNYLTKQLHKEAEEVEVLTASGSVMVNKTLLNDGKKTYSVLFWYEMSGRKMADLHKAKFATLSDAIIKRRTNGAFVMVTSEVNPSDDFANIVKKQQRFIYDISPELDRRFYN